MRWLDDITNSMDMNLSKFWEIVEDRRLACYSPWGHQESDRTERLSLSLLALNLSQHQGLSQ